MNRLVSQSTAIGRDLPGMVVACVLPGTWIWCSPDGTTTACSCSIRPGLFAACLVFLQHFGRPRFGGLAAVEHRRAVAGARISPGTGLGFVLPVSHAVRARRPLACTRYIRPIARKNSVSAPGWDRSGLSESGPGRRRPRWRGRGAWFGSGPTSRGRSDHPVEPGHELRVGLGWRLWRGGLLGRGDRRQLAGPDGNDHQVKDRDRPVRFPVRTPRPVGGRGRVQLGPLPLSEPGRVGRVARPGCVTGAVVARRVIPDQPRAGDVAGLAAVREPKACNRTVALHTLQDAPWAGRDPRP